MKEDTRSLDYCSYDGETVTCLQVLLDGSSAMLLCLYWLVRSCQPPRYTARMMRGHKNLVLLMSVPAPISSRKGPADSIIS